MKMKCGVLSLSSYRSALLTFLLIVSLGAACTSTGETQDASALSYEEAKKQVPLEGSGKEPLFWRIGPFSDPDAAAAAEAVQHYIVVFDIVSDTKPIDRMFFELMSHFATSERIIETQFWFDGPRSPSPSRPDLMGPRWMWIIDVSSLPDNDLGVTVCVDGGWYGYHPGGVFRRQEGKLSPNWGLEGYIVRRVEDRGVERWKVHDTTSVSRFLPQEKVELLEEQCTAWATHEWKGSS